ncbi:MAG: hypothetical protein AABX28_01585 [Nanoarchaeota archaeon]
MIKIKNKKGFLLAEETLKIVIALIALGFLVYFLTALYFANINKQKLEQAENSLTRIGEIFDGLAEGNFEVQDISNPKGWHLFSFVENVKPNSCAGENCICICSRVYDDPIRAIFVSWEERQAKECTDGGSCLIAENLGHFDEIKIKNTDEGLTQVLIKKENNMVLMSEVK